MAKISLIGMGVLEKAKEIVSDIGSLPEAEQIEILNSIKVMLHSVSPLREEPIDCVLWVPGDRVESNSYNPNFVAPAEMRLLTHSIEKNGFAMPVVTWPVNGHYETVDGFHRGKVGKTNKKISKRLRGYLPITFLNPDRYSLPDRMAATIEFNRARGKHQIEDMSKIVVELKKRNWSDEKIGKELGMDADEVLRLAQVSGLKEVFADREFSEAWEVKFDD